jgi:hypothetical protein
MAQIDIDLQGDVVAAIRSGVLGLRGDSYNVVQIANLLAAFDSAAYYQQHMFHCETAADSLQLL